LSRLQRPGIFHRDDVAHFECWRGFQRFRDHPGWVDWFDRYLRAIEPDAVLGYNNLNCPLLKHAVSEGYPALFIVRSLANLFGVSRYVPSGVRLLANSPFTASVAEAAFGDRPQVVLPLVDLDAYRVAEREPRFITFINPMPEKGVEVAVEIARAMPNRHFLFVKGKWGGRSYDSLDLSGLDNVEVWDYQEDMRSVYAVTDILLMPSQWLESFGRVILEAQASGIPVVASDVGGIPFVLGDGGVVVSPKTNVEGFVSALCRLVEERDFHGRLSEAAARNARRSEFEPEAQVDAFVRAVEEEVEARHASF
jgi:glycosyltransferase involved in cell wall biosynthesis